MVRAASRARSRSAGMAITVAVGVALLAILPGSAAAATHRRRRRPRRAAPGASGSPTGTPATARPSAGTLSLVSAKTTPAQVLLLRLPLPEPALHDRQHPAAERPPDRRRRRRPAKSSQTFYRNDVAPDVDSQDPLGRDDRTKAAGAATAATASGSAPSGDRRASPRRKATSSTEPLSLGFAFYGYAFPILGTHDYGDAAPAASAPAAPATPTRART